MSSLTFCPKDILIWTRPHFKSNFNKKKAHFVYNCIYVEKINRKYWDWRREKRNEILNLSGVKKVRLKNAFRLVGMEQRQKENNIFFFRNQINFKNLDCSGIFFVCSKWLGRWHQRNDRVCMIRMCFTRSVLQPVT